MAKIVDAVEDAKVKAAYAVDAAQAFAATSSHSTVDAVAVDRSAIALDVRTMDDINFAAFNPRSFEQFAQALTAAVLGPGILVFGDGPDQGREASFDGPVDYPNVGSRWTGLTIMQAKFRLRPTGGSDDADWLAGQLRGELAKYEAEPRRRRPTNYIAAIGDHELRLGDGAEDLADGHGVAVPRHPNPHSWIAPSWEDGSLHEALAVQFKQRA